MAAPVMGADTTTTEVHVVFAALTSAADRGGADIERYELSWKSTTFDWTILMVSEGAQPLATEKKTSATGGAQYRFRVRAYNKHGWSPDYSPEGVIYATGKPATPDPVVTSQANRDIELRWTAPFNNYESIDAFRVLVKTSTGSDSYEEERTHCAGDSAAIMAMSEPACLIPVAVLTAAPFSLSAGATVVARVLAHNARGWGLPSTPNDVGGIITTVPHQMAAPTRDDAGTSTVAIKVNWLPLNAPENGMSDIQSYNL
jgi:hypothetical protein